MSDNDEKNDKPRSPRDKLRDADKHVAKAAELAQRAHAEAEAAAKERIARLQQMEQQIQARAVENAINEELTKRGIHILARPMAIKEIVSQLRDVNVDESFCLTARYGDEDELVRASDIAEKFLERHPYMVGPRVAPSAESEQKPAQRKYVDKTLNSGAGLISQGLRGRDGFLPPYEEPEPQPVEHPERGVSLIAQGLAERE